MCLLEAHGVGWAGVRVRIFLRVPWALSEVGGVRTAAVRAFEVRWGIEGFDAFVRVVVPSAFHAPGFKVAVGTAMAELQAVVALGSPNLW